MRNHRISYPPCCASTAFQTKCQFCATGFRLHIFSYRTSPESMYAPFDAIWIFGSTFLLSRLFACFLTLLATSVPLTPRRFVLQRIAPSSLASFNVEVEWSAPLKSASLKLALLKPHSPHLFSTLNFFKCVSSNAHVI